MSHVKIRHILMGCGLLAIVAWLAYQRWEYQRTRPCLLISIDLIQLKSSDGQDNPECTVHDWERQQKSKRISWSQLEETLQRYFDNNSRRCIMISYLDSKWESIDDARYQRLEAFVLRHNATIHRGQAAGGTGGL